MKTKLTLQLEWVILISATFGFFLGYFFYRFIVRFIFHLNDRLSRQPKWVQIMASILLPGIARRTFDERLNMARKIQILEKELQSIDSDSMPGTGSSPLVSKETGRVVASSGAGFLAGLIVDQAILEDIANIHIPGVIPGIVGAVIGAHLGTTDKTKEALNELEKYMGKPLNAISKDEYVHYLNTFKARAKYLPPLKK